MKYGMIKRTLPVFGAVLLLLHLAGGNGWSSSHRARARSSGWRAPRPANRRGYCRASRRRWILLLSEGKARAGDSFVPGCCKPSRTRLR